MRIPLLTFWLLIKLWWGRILNPIFSFNFTLKFLPPAKRIIFHKALADYFFKN